MTTPIQDGELLWHPSSEIIEQANITQFIQWLAKHHDLHFADYDELWAWSVDDLAAFWSLLADYCEIKFTQKADTILVDNKMPHAEWFVGAELNYSENIFQKMSDARPMMLYKAEDKPTIEISWQSIYQQVNQLSSAMRKMGVTKGDRVVNFMPNRPESIVALLATASIGAIWSSCSPDFGAQSVLDRFTQIEPKLLFAVDAYTYGGKAFDRRDVVTELQSKLPTLEHTILVPHLAENTDNLQNTALWEDVLKASNPPEKIEFEAVPFDHPLWVLYSSGTTGLPKPIVHGHGGIILEHAKAAIFHNDLSEKDRFFWFSSTGWMMWNYLVGVLLSGATILLYDGSPAYPTLNTLFQFAEETGMTYFGTSAAFINACIKANLSPNQDFDLSKIRAVGSTGSPLTINGFGWIYENINADLALESLSGGTDLCGVLVGGARTKPIYAGEIQAASLGVDIKAYNDEGQQVVNEVGELVITSPLPSMPIYFWNDAGMERYKSAYFEMYEGVWRHGDWIEFNERGGCIIYGRSDSTINRQGIRMGTSEIYQAVESLPEILDSLIIDLELLGRESYMPLFVVLRDTATLNDDLKQAIKQKLRAEVSPRHVPNEIFQIDTVPYTLSGKKMEVPIRKILLGRNIEKSINTGAMRNPDSIAYFIDFAKKLNTDD